ncbi:MAG: ribonuclease J [Deltaproteobacteria bacterium]|nr:ribonuclease J [Deltaproteobacteria bacterium]
MLKIIPLGGLGEIGLNMMIIQHGSHMVVIDAGLMFPDDYMLGVDLVIPDFSYLRENREKIEAVILTHGHEDHIGALPFLLKEFPVRVFGTGFTLDLLREKLKEHILPQNADLQTVIPGEIHEIGPFKVEHIRVNHSIVDGAGLALETPEGLILHSGDFRIDPTPVDEQTTDLIRFAHFGEKGVLAFFSDSTNAEKEGYTLSERDVKKTLRDFFLTCPGRLIVASFASNITRIQEVISLAEEFGRKVVFNGKSMITNVGIARAHGFVHFSEDLEITEKKMKSLPDRQVVVITTGSQGEPMSALSRMARDQHKGIKIHKGDTIILSSRFIPGNEKAITSVINKLYGLGADVIYENVSDIHTSGHARQAELKIMLSLVKPRYFIPVHGEYRHLVKHARIALDMGMDTDHVLIARDGDVISFDEGIGKIKGTVPTGRTFVDGKGVGDIEETVLRDRKKLRSHGMVVVQMVLDEQTGKILFGPEMISRGFVFEDQGKFILEDAQCIVLEVVDEIEKPCPVDGRRLEAEIRKRLKRFFYNVIKRSPLIIPTIIVL